MHQLPDPDEITKTKIRRLLTTGAFFPVMNNTKWAELINAMINAPHMKPEFRLHSVFAPSDHSTDWDGEWHYHIHPVAEVEWIELRADSIEWLLSTLRKHNLPFCLEDGVPRVWGYTRPGMQPLWD